MTTRKRSLYLLSAIIAWWSLYGLMLASQFMVMRSKDDALTWPRALAYAYGITCAWIPLTCAAYYLAQRYPLGKTDIARRLFIHGCAVAAFILFLSVYTYVANPLIPYYDVLPPFIDVLDSSMRYNLTLCCMVVGLAHGIVYYERSEERERKLLTLEKSLISAKLEALSAQLNPHFLFNALNSVAELMHEDIEQADNMLVSVCNMMRDGLRPHEAQERPLKEELLHVSNYLTIESIRLGDRLASSVEVDDACLDIPIPVLSLQPVVENAIVHSIARTKQPGWVRISGWTDQSDLHLTVENSATAPTHAKKEGNGIALRTIAERLELLYGSRAHIERTASHEDTYSVHIIVPLPGTLSSGAT
jgi:hypothetical protein